MWKDVVGFENFYEVSSDGEVRSKLSGKILKPCLKRNGYYAVCLCDGNVKKWKAIHRIVAETFIPNPFGLICVNHMDEDKTNNRSDNLEWCTYQYNCRYGKGALAKNRRVIQYDMAGNAIAIWESMKEAANATGAIEQGISACCRKVKKSSGGYMWTYARIGELDANTL